jgi:hypothetical protein
MGMLMCLAVGIAGCGSKVSGKYVSDGGAMTVEFKSGQAVLSDILGNSETCDYTVSDSTVTLKSKQRGDIILTITKDGDLSGNGVVLKKAAG